MSAEKRGVTTVGLLRCDGWYLTPMLVGFPAFLSFDVILDGPSLLLTSSRTARRAEPGSRKAPRKCLRPPTWTAREASRCSQVAGSRVPPTAAPG